MLPTAVCRRVVGRMRALAPQGCGGLNSQTAASSGPADWHARVGLPTALAPTRASRFRFDAPVGATGRTNRKLLTCIGRDHRRVQFEPLLWSVSLRDEEARRRSRVRFPTQVRFPPTPQRTEVRHSRARNYPVREGLSAPRTRATGGQAGRTAPQNVAVHRRWLCAEWGQPAFPSRFPAAATEHSHIS